MRAAARPHSRRCGRVFVLVAPITLPTATWPRSARSFELIPSERGAISCARRIASRLALVLYRRIRESSRLGRAGQLAGTGSGERSHELFASCVIRRESPRFSKTQGIPVPAVRRDPKGLPRDGSWLVKPLRREEAATSDRCDEHDRSLGSLLFPGTDRRTELFGPLYRRARRIAAGRRDAAVDWHAGVAVRLSREHRALAD